MCNQTDRDFETNGDVVIDIASMRMYKEPENITRLADFDLAGMTKKMFSEILDSRWVYIEPEYVVRMSHTQCESVVRTVGVVLNDYTKRELDESLILEMSDKIHRALLDLASRETEPGVFAEV